MIDLEIDRLNWANAMLAAEDEEIRDALGKRCFGQNFTEKKRWKEEQKADRIKKGSKKKPSKSKSEYAELEMERKHQAESLDRDKGRNSDKIHVLP